MDEVGEALYLPRFHSVTKDYERSLTSNNSLNDKISKVLRTADAVVVFENITMKHFHGRPPHIDYHHPPHVVGGFKFLFIEAIVFLAPLLTFVLVIIRLTEEKSTGLEEVVKMFGASPLMIDITQYLNALLPSILFSVAGTFILYAIPIRVHPMILFLGLFLHYASMIALAFVCSYINMSGQNTASTALFLYFGTWIVVMLIWPGDKNNMFLILKGLLPHVPQIWFIYQMYSAELYIWRFSAAELDFKQWTNQFPLPWDRVATGSIRMAFQMFLIQICLLFLLSWYLHLVRPRKYGIALPWNFPFRKDFWVKNCEYIPHSISMQNHHPAYDRYFENPPTDLEEAVEVVNIKKAYSLKRSSIVALNDISLKFYRGEITVIIGHNGAGKTTLISIIAGMIQQSSGKVFIDRLDTTTQMAKIKKQIALCPQNTILFPDLTVREHLMFFSKLTGYNSDDSKKATERLLTQMDLIGNAAATPSKLSAGMTRRLQIACMLCSEANLLLLDAPTAGLDVEARKDLWQILFTLRGTRTIIMTTHFLDEADLLGDRVVTLHWGVLRSYATPLFLKMAVGSGSRVALTTLQPPDLDLISRMVRGAAPDATLYTRTVRTLVYDIPPGSDMAALFNNIEANRVTLDVESLGVGPVSLEEAFMKLSTDVEVDTFKERDRVLKDPEEFSYPDKWPVLINRVRELFKRQLDYSLSNLLAFIFLHFIVPISMCIIVTLVFNNTRHKGFMMMDLSIYDEADTPLATYNIRGNSTNRMRVINKLRELYPQLMLREENEEHDKFCTCKQCSKRSGRPFSPNIIDIYVDEHNARLNYDRNVRHSAAVGLNLLSNIVAAEHLPRFADKAITMQLAYVHMHWLKPKDQLNCLLMLIFNVYIVMATAINDVGLPCRERLANTRYLHIMAGCPPVLYWLVTFLYQIICYAVLHCTGVVIAVVFLDKDETFNNFPAMRAFFVALLICGIDLYAFFYLLSQFFDEKTTDAIILMLLILFGIFTPFYMYTYRNFHPHTPMFHTWLENVGVFVPMHMFTRVLRQMSDISRLNAHCPRVMGSCPRVRYSYYDMRPCCECEELIVFVGQSLLLLVEYRMFSRLWNQLERRRTIVMPTRKYESADVAAEKEYIKHTIKRCECFGIVGLNGAGKTTTFKVMTHQELITKGMLYANGYYAHENTAQYLWSLGYSPQSLALDTFRSGSANLRLLLFMRGLDEEDVRNETGAWIKIFGLERYSLLNVGEYSAGMWRRLSVGAALCGGPRVSLLDEPTLNVDPAARHQLWAALEDALSIGRSVVIASHHMEEVDNMCNQLTILDDGEMGALGSPNGFKKSYAPGHTVVIKLRANSVLSSAGAARIQALKDFMAHEFSSFLKEDYFIALRYILSDDLRYNVIYSKLSTMANEFREIVEDFYAYDANFEDAFVQFVNDSRYFIKPKQTW
ncbi:unnamed protein product, partial [Iphiclides podalirius]